MNASRTVPRRTLPPTLGLPGAGLSALVTGVLGLLVVGAAALAGGGPQMAGAGIGTVLVCGFFAFGVLNTSLAAAYAPRLSMLVALLTYLVQVVVLALVLVWLSRSGLVPDTVDARWLGLTVIAGTFAWTGVLVARALTGPETRR